MEALEQRIDELENRVTALERRVQEQPDEIIKKVNEKLSTAIKNFI